MPGTGEIAVKVAQYDRLLSDLSTVDDDMMDLSTLRGVVDRALRIDEPTPGKASAELADRYRVLAKKLTEGVQVGVHKTAEDLPNDWQDSAGIAATKALNRFDGRVTFLSGQFARVADILDAYSRGLDGLVSTDAGGVAALRDAQGQAARIGYSDALLDIVNSDDFDKPLQAAARRARAGIDARKDALDAERIATETAVAALAEVTKAVSLRDVSDVQPTGGRTVIGPDGGKVFVLPETTVFGGGGGSLAGRQAYDSPDDAARAALKEIYGPSMDHNAEYAGNIYKLGDRYYFSPPATRGSHDESYASDSPVPAGAQIVGTYHSHAAGTEPSDEVFSHPDETKAVLGGKDSYLLTPRGDMYRYTPVQNLPPEEQARFSKGKTTSL